MKLTYSLLLLVFSVIIIAEITGIYILYEFKNTMEDQIMNDSEKLNIMMINRIDSYATERLVDLMNLVKSGAFHATIQESNTQFSKMSNPEQYVDEMDSVWTSTPSNETTPFMKTLIESKLSEQLRQIQNAENKLFQGKVYGVIFVTNAYGANVIQSDRTSDYKQSDEVWWQEARKNGIYVGGTELDDISGLTAYTVAARLDDENGNFIGVAKAIVNIEQIINIVKTQMNTTSSINPIEYELIKPDGIIIYSTNSDEKPNTLHPDQKFFNSMKDFSGHFTYTENDQLYLVTYSHSSSSKISPLFNWIFVTKYKSSEILEPVIKVSNDITMLMAIAITTISITVFIVSKKLGTPIEKMHEAMLEYNKGNRIELEPHGTLEIKNLISDFNNMTKKISDAYDTIAESEAKFRTVFELTPVVIILSDENYNIRDTNQRFLELFEYESKDEIIGKSYSIIVPERTLKEYTEFQSGSEDRIIDKKVWLMKKDKTEFPCSISAQKIYYNKKLIGNISVIKDLTFFKSKEMEIKKVM